MTATATSTTGASTRTSTTAARGSVGTLLRVYATEMKLFTRESSVLIFVFGFPIITTLVLGGVFGTDTDDSGFEYLNPSHFYTTAYFGVVLAAIGLIMLPVRVA